MVFNIWFCFFHLFSFFKLQFKDIFPIQMSFISQCMLFMLWILFESWNENFSSATNNNILGLPNITNIANSIHHIQKLNLDQI